MSTITDVKCVLTQKSLNAFCNKFHIPKEVHHVLPNQNDTMHERPARKIRLYTSFFDFANFRLPLSAFFIDILRHFCINISQLSVIGAAKVSHFEILCHVYGILSTVDEFACLTLFPLHTTKHVTRDPALVAADFNAKITPLLLLIPFRSGNIFAFIHTLDPTKVRVVKQERDEGEPRLLDTIVGRTVLLFLVAPDRADSELEASVDRLFDESGSGNQTQQGDFIGGEQDANLQPVVEAADTFVESVAPVQSRRQGKRKSVIVDASGVSHPPKKLREDHGTSSGASVGASVSTTPEREGGDHTDYVVEPNLYTIGASSSVLIMTTVTTVTSTVDPTLVTKEKLVEPSSFGAGSSSAGGTDPVTDSVTNGSRLDDGRVCREMVDEFAPSKFFASVCGMEHDQLFTEFNVGAARQMSLSAKVRMHAEYNVKEKRRLKSVVESQGELLKAREEEIESLKAWLLLKEAEAAKAIRLRVEASNFETVEKSLRDETNTLKERNVILEKERNALDVKVTELETSGMSKERELIDLNAVVTFVKSQNDSLADQVHKLETSSFGLQERIIVYENCMDQLEKFQGDQMKVVNDKFDMMYADFVKMVLHLEEKLYPHLLTTIFGRKWLLTHGMELAIANFLNSHEYLSALGAAIGKAIEKGMQDGLAARITHGKEDRVLIDVDAYNPSAEVDYVSSLQL
uniref:Putative transposase (Putative), gypsy type n=1 Tax=Tanacetum cinerariifolium TaxID=118510 RepID=A0A699I599_TANCI|nr:putative transposase (putative), gypsy type [Tanacetum cinerariifolium]